MSSLSKTPSLDPQLHLCAYHRTWTSSDSEVQLQPQYLCASDDLGAGFAAPEGS